MKELTQIDWDHIGGLNEDGSGLEAHRVEEKVRRDVAYFVQNGYIIHEPLPDLE